MYWDESMHKIDPVMAGLDPALEGGPQPVNPEGAFMQEHTPLFASGFALDSTQPGAFDSLSPLFGMGLGIDSHFEPFSSHPPSMEHALENTGSFSPLFSGFSDSFAPTEHAGHLFAHSGASLDSAGLTVPTLEDPAHSPHSEDPSTLSALDSAGSLDAGTLPHPCVLDHSAWVALAAGLAAHDQPERIAELYQDLAKQMGWFQAMEQETHSLGPHSAVGGQAVFHHVDGLEHVDTTQEIGILLPIQEAASEELARMKPWLVASLDVTSERISHVTPQFLKQLEVDAAHYMRQSYGALGAATRSARRYLAAELEQDVAAMGRYSAQIKGALENSLHFEGKAILTGWSKNTLKNVPVVGSMIGYGIEVADGTSAVWHTYKTGGDWHHELARQTAGITGGVTGGMLSGWFLKIGLEMLNAAEMFTPLGWGLLGAEITITGLASIYLASLAKTTVDKGYTVFDSTQLSEER